jgi:hypothetical protein
MFRGFDQTKKKREGRVGSIPIKGLRNTAWIASACVGTVITFYTCFYIHRGCFLISIL